MNCKKVVKCPECDYLADLVGTVQTADGKVFCKYWCDECQDNFEIKRRQNK